MARRPIYDWRELFDVGFCDRIRDVVCSLLPDRLDCLVGFERNELFVIIHERPGVRAYWEPDVDAFAKPARRPAGFRFCLPPLESRESQEWLDQGETQLASLLGAVREHLPRILAEFEPAHPCSK